jgi:hypothetical protein
MLTCLQQNQFHRTKQQDQSTKLAEGRTSLITELLVGSDPRLTAILTRIANNNRREEMERKSEVILCSRQLTVIAHPPGVKVTVLGSRRRSHTASEAARLAASFPSL